jgi:hypothetical protein
MNVAEIRQRIFDQMDYFPDLQQYRDSVVRRINERYQEINDTAHWLFLQKEHPLQLRKDIIATTATYFNSGVRANPQYIQVDSTNPRLIYSPDLTDANTYDLTYLPTLIADGVPSSNVNFTYEMQGALLLVGNNKYRIVGIKNERVMFVEPLDGAGELDNTIAQTKDFTIQFDRYRMPQDCIEVLGFTDRDDDRGRLLYIDRRREEFAYLDRDNKGDPSTAIDDDFVLDEPPLNTPTATATTSASGDLIGGNKYEYKYTIWREGRESPPSLKVQVTLGATDNAVDLANIDDTGWFDSATTTADSGIVKAIYRRDVTKDTKWVLVDGLTSLETTTTDDKLVPRKVFEGYPANSAFQYLHPNELERWSDAGPAQYIRFWYRPDVDKRIHMRYHFRPKDLVADNDAPQWPRQYHMLIVHLVLQDMFLQMQDTVQSQLFERRANIILEQMRRRYLSRDDVKKRFMSWSRPRRFRNIYGPPSITS